MRLYPSQSLFERPESEEWRSEQEQGHKLTLFVSVLMAIGQHTLAKVLASHDPRAGPNAQ